MVKIVALSFNPFGENTYVVSDESGECVIVDAGNYSAAEDAALARYVADNGLRPVAAINTHGHIDHILGVDYAKDTFSVPFAVHGEDNFLVESAPMHGRLYGFELAAAPVPDIDLSQQDEVRFGNSVLQIIHTPGHTPGHVCFFDAGGRQLLTGDTLFRESIGRTDLPGGDYSWIMRSILDRIIPLGDDVKVFPGHGPATTIGHETLYNPFITEVLGGEVNYK